MEELRLKNGIIVHVEDKTVPLTGDLYMVRIAITFRAQLDEADTELRSFCGDAIVKTRILERPAVQQNRLDEVKRSIKESYLNTTLRYLEHPRFVSRLKEKTLQEYHEKLEKEAKMRAAGIEPE